ncbi:sugar phosphate isomerase/epimerase [Pontibacter qinzhouensis]|uniref:Sugar phosphate isomerase/epimerase n=1 Tax=Pontibacter qinzhouensis TaxID=2603253 RepID=A0A5C8K643_9BACT|nr:MULTISPECIES: sugar phosphate isomerase/epimerase [Pontibacter]TXK45731.1 sugar phosphate isomerase/epimerase [Pontibacter qinzhouensis]
MILHVKILQAFACLVLLLGGSLAAYAQKHPEAKLGWELGAQAYTFKNFTFYEALSKIDSCGLKYVEAYPGQPLGGGLEGKMDIRMEAEKRQQLLAMLKKKGIKMKAFGVVSPGNAEDWRQLFIFAKAMGIETITSEPKLEDLPLVSQLCDEFKIKVAIHNHPTPSRYWNPAIVEDALKGQSKRMGVCADIGHWTRSGIDPVASLKQLEGRIFHLHVKDLHEQDLKGHDVHWGQGVTNIAGVIGELKRQKFKGMLSAEYEYNWNHNTPDVKQSVTYFRSVVSKK